MEDVYALYKKLGLTPKVITAFQETIYGYYREQGRSFPWREKITPYRILVSEMMLQQTQTSRVIGKFNEFLQAFPDIGSLAEAPFREVLAVWQGLGYNRRAMALQNAAKAVVAEYGGEVPSDPDLLLKLPGVGAYTAGAVTAIAFDKPAVFIDTNIRSIYHWFFFRDEETASDKKLMPVIEATLDRDSPREWYFALFDYGVMLKKEKRNELPGTPKKQAKFHGSDRQVRGKVVKLLLEKETMTEDDLIREFPDDEERVKRLVGQLCEEGLVMRDGGVLKIG